MVCRVKMHRMQFSVPLYGLSTENAPNESESGFCTALYHFLYSWRAVSHSVSEHRRLVRTPSRGCTRGFGHSKAASAVSSLVKEGLAKKL
jgi:hypothetical protein